MIAVKNIYYMLSYAFEILNKQGYQDVAAEKFDNTAELCAAILAKGITVQIKRGIERDYISVTESRSSLRGKLDISESIKDRTILKKQIVCTYDEFSVNSYMNRIIKSTVILLLHSDIMTIRKKEFRKLMIYFKDIGTLNIRHINWNLPYNRTNQTYRMLISVCYLVIEGLLQTQADGTMKLMDFFDEQRMCRLYEKFILKYYQREFPQITARAARIHWQLDTDERSFLPVMQSDVMLSYQDKTLIIDAKYYRQIMQTRFDKKTLHSSNLYQIFTYVKNKQTELGDGKSVSGMLLYAQTGEDHLPDNEYQMSGNKICVRTLNLNVEFLFIAEQLNQIVKQYLGAEKEN